MPGGIAVTPEQLRAYGARLSGAAEEIDAIVSQLRAQLAPMQEEWAGAASAAFAELWQKWQRDASGLEEALSALAELARRAAATYETTEADITAALPWRA